jgi:hypothetical protein
MEAGVNYSGTDRRWVNLDASQRWDEGRSTVIGGCRFCCSGRVIIVVYWGFSRGTHSPIV